MTARDEVKTTVTGDDAISFVEIVSSTLKHWRAVVLLPLVLAATAALWSLSGERQYVASASLIQHGGANQGGGGTSAIAQQFGLNIGGSHGAESPIFFMELLRSNTLLRRVVEAIYTLREAEGEWTGTLVEYWAIPRDAQIPASLQATERLRSHVEPAVSRESGLLVFSVTANHPDIAEQIARNFLVSLEAFNLERRRKRASDEGRFAEERAEEARRELDTAEVEIRDFLSRNRMYQNSPELVLEYDRLQRTAGMRLEVYSSAVRWKEQAMLDVIRNTPLFMVVDLPEGSTMPKSRGTMKKTISGFVVGLLLAVLLAVFQESSWRVDLTSNARHGQLSRVFWEVLEEMRNPRRWMS